MGVTRPNSHIQLDDESIEGVKLIPKTVTSNRLADEVVASADKYYRHQQGAPEAVWTVNHNLGKFPSVTVFDSTGDQIMVLGDVKHLNMNTLTITFSVPFGGEAFCN